MSWICWSPSDNESENGSALYSGTRSSVGRSLEFVTPMLGSYAWDRGTASGLRLGAAGALPDSHRHDVVVYGGVTSASLMMIADGG
jgi:hypothetical protein